MTAPNRIVDHRALALLILQINPHRFQNRQQIRKQNGSVHTKNLPGSHRDLTGQLGSLAELHEGNFAADCHVLRQITTGLPHDPQRSRIDGLPMHGPHEATVRQPRR
jgi:hypothetical protein